LLLLLLWNAPALLAFPLSALLTLATNDGTAAGAAAREGMLAAPAPLVGAGSVTGGVLAELCCEPPSLPVPRLFTLKAGTPPDPDMCPPPNDAPLDTYA
jgi:hypothetical protein